MSHGLDVDVDLGQLAQELWQAHLEEFVEGVVLVQAGDAVEREHRSWDHDGIDGCGLDDLAAHVEQLLRDYMTVSRHNLCGLGEAFEAAVNRATEDGKSLHSVPYNGLVERIAKLEETEDGKSLHWSVPYNGLVERIAKLEETVTVLANGLRTTFGSLRALP